MKNRKSIKALLQSVYILTRHLLPTTNFDELLDLVKILKCLLNHQEEMLSIYQKMRGLVNHLASRPKNLLKRVYQAKADESTNIRTQGELSILVAVINL